MPLVGPLSAAEANCRVGPAGGSLQRGMSSTSTGRGPFSVPWAGRCRIQGAPPLLRSTGLKWRAANAGRAVCSRAPDAAGGQRRKPRLASMGLESASATAKSLLFFLGLTVATQVVKMYAGQK